MLITYFTITSFLLMELFFKCIYWYLIIVKKKTKKKTKKKNIANNQAKIPQMPWCMMVPWVHYQKKSLKKIMQIQQHKIYLLYISLIVVKIIFNYLIEVFKQKLFIDGISSLHHGPACLLQRRQNIIPLTSLQLCSLRTWSL